MTGNDEHKMLSHLDGWILVRCESLLKGESSWKGFYQASYFSLHFHASKVLQLSSVLQADRLSLQPDNLVGPDLLQGHMK